MSSDEKEPLGAEPRDGDETTASGGPATRPAPAGAVAREDDPAPATEPAVEPAAESAPAVQAESKSASYYDDPYDYEYDDPHAKKEETAVAAALPEPAKTPPPPPPADTDDEEEDADDEGMLRMSFLEHLEELRVRIIRTLIGLVVSFLTCLMFARQLFTLFRTPFERAASKLPYDPPLQLTQITPTEQFLLEYFQLPLLAGLFLAAPWVMYQAWSFIAPGLYKRERRWAVPFIVSTAALFILGGAFCYFIALRFALGFLIGLGFEENVRPMISLTSYYDMFFNLHVGLGVVFQMPVVIIFFTLLRITSPKFLLDNVRYAILIIFIIAAVITPTPDVATMLTFAAPMVLLFYVGIGGSYLIVLRRENRRFPWLKFLKIVAIVLAILAAVAASIHFGLGYEYGGLWPNR